MPPQTTDTPPVPVSKGRIAVVLVNWNGWEDTLAAFESLKASTCPDWEAIVIDNGSTDGSLAKLRGDKPRFVLVESPTNLGFAGACNLAVDTARRRGAEYVYFLNNDATAEPATLEILLRQSRELDDGAILGSVLRFADDGRLQFWGSHEHPSGLPVWTEASEERFAEAPALIPSAFIMGASLFVPMTILDRVGRFEDRYFLNFEETDWCYRARRLDYRCFVVKAAVARHKGGATIGHPQGPLQVYFMRRNRLLFCERHCSPGQFAIIYARQATGAVVRFVTGLLGIGSPASRMTARAHVIGTLDYTLRRFGDCPPLIRKMAADYRA